MSGPALVALLAASLSAAQERPAEESLFGAPPAAEDERPGEDSLFGSPGDGGTAGGSLSRSEPPGPEEGDPRDLSQLSGAAATSRFDTREEKEDPLQVGGTLYLRAAMNAADGNRVDQIRLTAPSLMDGYFDARPSDRVRGMMLARLQYDPTLAQGASGSPISLPGSPAAANPSVGLDQLWIRFDLARTVFVTAGKQHVKWGASRFWNPTDFLSPQRRDPLAPFDARLGATMLKLHLPWEATGWNFYAIGLLDNAGPAGTLGGLGGAARAEVVLGATELGADAVFVGGRRPRFGVDLSSALGAIDVYAEVAFRNGADFQVWSFSREVDWNDPIDALAALQSSTPGGVQVQASGGLTYTFNYTEKNAVTVGGEYFYNPVGASSRAVYPWLIFQNQFQPFFVGQHYAAVYAVAPGLPGDLSHVTLSLSTLGNLSDRSFITRLDGFIRVLSYLSIELFGAVNYGDKGGELRFALDLPSIPIGPEQVTPAIAVPAPVFSLGAGLRVSL